MYALFALIAFFATLAGAVFGIGGGVIIKPVMEAVSNLPLAHINALSGVTVLCMAAVSIARYLKKGIDEPTARIIWLSLGAVAGGFCGKYLFNLMRLTMPEAHAKALQYTLLTALMIAALLKHKFKSFTINNPVALSLSGLFMGTLSAFLGIGGGPVNLLVIYVALGLDAKRAAVYSVAVILFSQFAMTCLTAATGGYEELNMRPLAAMIPAAIAGGLIGPILHRKWELIRFERYYNYLLWALIALNVYNIAHVLL